MAEEGVIILLTARLDAVRLDAARVGFIVRNPVGDPPGVSPFHFAPHRTVELPSTSSTSVLEP